MKKIIINIIAGLICASLIVLGVIFNPPSFTDLQKETLIILVIICGASALYCFIVGEISRNNSQMDKLWSITPIVYSWIIAIKDWGNIRILIIAILVTIWGGRLTYNFAKKGAYSIKFWEGEEDYRWIVLRQNKYFKNKFVWGLFDLFFISIFQNYLVLAICLPSLTMMGNNAPFNVFDIIAPILILGFIILETIADKQQMAFYDKRKELMKDGKTLEEIEYPYNKGFNTMGLWKYSRHPNYFSEQAIWVSVYLYTFACNINTYYVFNWSIIGCMVLIILFIGSSTFSESMSAKKYKDYKEYIKTTSKYIPWFK